MKSGGNGEAEIGWLVLGRTWSVCRLFRELEKAENYCEMLGCLSSFPSGILFGFRG